MKAVNVKLIASILILIMIFTITPAMGFTSLEADDRQGVVIDFGYWDVVWTETVLEEGMNGNDALKEACHINDFDYVFKDQEESILFSVNEQVNLYGMTWGMYVLNEGNWTKVEDPRLIDVSEYNMVCWARAAGEESIIPGVDSSGFTYYSYATDGISYNTGEKLRAVSLAPSITETIASIGGTEYIVATDLYSDYPQEITDLKEEGTISVIGGYTDPNYEWILKAEPDVVFCDGGTGEHINMANKLRKSGIDCVVLYNGTDIETLYDNIWITAAAMGLESNANSCINSIRETINVVSGIIGVQPLKRAFVSLSADPSPWTSGSDTFMSDLISKVSGINVFDSQSSSWFMVSKEQIHAKQPGVIVILSEKEITDEETYLKIVENLDPVWKETPAYRNGEIYIFSGDSADIMQRPGPRLSEAAELLGKIFHTGQFLDRDPLDYPPKYFGNDYEQYLKYQKVKA